MSHDSRTDGPARLSAPALFYCRTPLHSMIVQCLVEKVDGPTVVLYHANTESPKHEAYFGAMRVDESHFIPYRPVPHSDTLGEVLTWWNVPPSLRRRRFRSLLVASVGSIPFGMLAVRNPDADLYTYDDGTFNLCEHVYTPWIAEEPPVRRAVKVLLRAGSNPGIVERAAGHFTIFPPRFVVGTHRRIEQVDVFDSEDGVSPRRGLRRARMILGAWSADPARQALYEKIVSSGRFDLFLPHPADSRPASCAPWLAEALGSRRLDAMIAEDVVRCLWSVGLRPVVYGFETTALYNVATHTVAISFLLGDGPPIVPSEVASDLGVRQLRCRYETDSG